jgi:hypothetical protein
MLMIMIVPGGNRNFGQIPSQVDRLAMRRVQVGTTPVLCGRANLLARRQTPLDKQLLQHRKPLSVVSGLAIFALALRFARDLGRKHVDPFRPGEKPRLAQSDRSREGLSVPGLRETWLLISTGQRERDHTLSM